MSERVAIGADHGGYDLKEHLKGWLTQRGYAVDDCGTFDGARCDYPQIAGAVAKRVSQGLCRFGIIIDGAGIGSSMVANKYAGVRAALCYDVSSANNSREHNDANVLTLGARLIGEGLAEQIVDVFLTTVCSEDRHQKRVAMIDEILGAASCATCATEATPPAGAQAGSQPGSQAGAGGFAWADFGLAGGRAPTNNAPASVQAFQARAAQQLMSDSSSTANLAAADLDRVAARMVELLSQGSVRGSLWCIGDVCIDARLAQPWIDAGVARLSSGLGNGNRVATIAGYIDHTLLKPDATAAEIDALCAEAREHSFASVCVNPTWVKRCSERLVGSPVKVCTVIGFPLGANVADLKAMEARRAIRDGAREIDMVINVGALKSGDDATVFSDIRKVVDACEDGRAICKVIIETALLSDEEKVRACVCAKEARADFVKTSTGFASGGATAEDVALMSRVVAGTRMGVKASGGVRSLDDLEAMVRAGATRIGASAGVRIVKEAGGATVSGPSAGY